MAKSKPKSNAEKVIRFTAQVARVQTLADGGIRLILDLPETAIQTATKMMEAKRSGASLEIAAVPVKVVKSKKQTEDFEVGDFEI